MFYNFSKLAVIINQLPYTKLESISWRRSSKSDWPTLTTSKKKTWETPYIQPKLLFFAASVTKSYRKNALILTPSGLRQIWNWRSFEVNFTQGNCFMFVNVFLWLAYILLNLREKLYIWEILLCPLAQVTLGKWI